MLGEILLLTLLLGADLYGGPAVGGAAKLIDGCDPEAVRRVLLKALYQGLLVYTVGRRRPPLVTWGSMEIDCM